MLLNYYGAHAFFLPGAHSMLKPALSSSSSSSSSSSISSSSSSSSCICSCSSSNSSSSSSNGGSCKIRTYISRRRIETYVINEYSTL